MERNNQMAEIDVLQKIVGIKPTNREINKMKPEIPVNGGMSGGPLSPVLGQKRPLTRDQPQTDTGQKKSPIRKGLSMLQQIRMQRLKDEEQKRKDQEEAEAAIRQIEEEKQRIEEAKKAAEQKIIQEKLDRIRHKRLRLSAAASVGRISGTAFLLNTN